MPQLASRLFDVSEKTVLITGASGYLGREIAQLFAVNGSQVIALGRSQKVFQVADETKRIVPGAKIQPFRVDFYNETQLKRMIQRIDRGFSIDVLINNAYDMGPETGFNTPQGKLENLGYKNWQKAFEAGIYWAFLLTQEIGKSMKKRGGGSIINVGSMYGVVSPDPGLYVNRSFFNPATYGVMKSGLLALTRYVASFWAKDRIRCNAVSPGPFSNTTTRSANGVAPKHPFLRRVANKTVLKRIGRPEELDGVFLLLASDASSYITGQNFIVDGGWTIT